ncbi:MAG: Lrp/AsnC family transcriptional regulator [Rhodothermales bacterium]
MPSDPKRLLDDLGWKILEALQDNARLSYSEIGRHVGLSSPAVAERVQKMEEQGIIAGYRAVVAPEHIGLPILTIVHLQVNRDQFTEVIARLRTLPEVLECHRTTGTSSLVMKVALTSIAHMESFLNELLRFGEPVSSIVLSTPIRERIFRKPTG